MILTRKNKRKIVQLGPFWMAGQSLVDEVTGHLDDVSAFMMNLKKTEKQIVFVSGLMLL